MPAEKTNINEIDISPLGLLITTYSSLQYHLRKYWSLFQIHRGWFLCLHRQIKGDDAMIPEVILSVRVIILYNKLYLVEGSFKRQERERERESTVHIILAISVNFHSCYSLEPKIKLQLQKNTD